MTSSIRGVALVLAIGATRLAVGPPMQTDSAGQDDSTLAERWPCA